MFGNLRENAEKESEQELVQAGNFVEKHRFLEERTSPVAETVFLESKTWKESTESRQQENV